MGIGCHACIAFAQSSVNKLQTTPQQSVSTFPLPGEWPAYRRDGTLQAHSPLKGKITKPSVAWKQFTGGLESLIIVEPGSSRSKMTLPSDEVKSADSIYKGDFVRIPPIEEENNMSTSIWSTYADVFPEYPGKEKIEFESAFQKTMTNGQWADCTGKCWAKKNGEWVVVWETKPIDELFNALPIVGDFDGDGTQEIAILPFYQMKLLDARTGVTKDSCRFNDNRSYGFHGVYDFNNDGKTEFLIQADFSKHVDVLGFKNGKLSLLWTQNIEQDIAHPQKILRVAPDPVADVEGDGKGEVITTLYNDSGDGKWHVSFLDGMTGTKKFDFPDEMFNAQVDLDNDGVMEILTTVTNQGGALARIRVRSIKGGKSRLLWEKDKINWQIYDQQLPRHVKSMATLSQQSVLHNKRGNSVDVVLREEAAGGITTLTLARWSGGQFKTITTVHGENLDALGFDAKGRMLVRSKHHVGIPASLSVTSGKAVQTVTSRIGYEPSSVIVTWPAKDAEPTVLVQGALLEQVAFKPPKNNGDKVMLRSITGRTQGTWWARNYGPVITDLEGDGNRQVIVADAGASGCARIAVKDLSTGKVIWQYEFPKVAGTPPPQNTGGVVLWQTGHFRDKKKCDVLVTTQWSKMHSEETYLLSGHDGKLIWHRDKQISKRAVGGNAFAIADYDGDGLDDLASLWPSILYTLKGTNGQDILAMDATWKEVYNKQVYFGQAVAGNFLNDGKPSFFFSGRLMTGVITSDGKLVWFDALDESAPHLPAVGDFDGDGKTEVAGAGFVDGLRCYEAATGRVKWRMPNPYDGYGGHGTHSESPVHGTATADLDGDGRDEALFAIDKTLFCIGAPKQGLTGEIRWKVDFPKTISTPTIVSLDKQGTVSILVADTDGYVYCVR